MQRRFRNRQDPARHELEEARHPEIDRDDHHAEKQQERVHVDGGEGLVERQHAEDDHQHRAHERACRPVDMHARDLAQADEDIGDDENDERGDHGEHFTMRGEGNSSGEAVEQKDSLLGSFFAHFQFLASYRASRPFCAFIGCRQPAIQRSVFPGRKRIYAAIQPIPGLILNKAAFLFLSAVFKSAKLGFLGLPACIPTCTVKHGTIFPCHDGRCGKHENEEYYN